MTREEAKAKAWADWLDRNDSVPTVYAVYVRGFDAGWEANDAARDAEWAQIMEDEGL